MKITHTITVGLPLFALALIASLGAQQKTNRAILASADGGSLPETKVLVAKIFAPGISSGHRSLKPRYAQVVVARRAN